ncbi:MAG: glycosyltransferase family 2 protein [Flavobacterium sp.]|nr:MAG: glycosyltransferase family 2 protein [Flavobacterium sp.]
MISVVIPHYNRSLLLKDALQSIQNQTFQDWEVIIVDDGSEEEQIATIFEYIQEEKRFTLLKRASPKKGPSACRNQGVVNAKGEFVVFLDSDDLLKNFCLQQRYEVIGNNPTIGIAVFLIENFTRIPGDLQTIFNSEFSKENLAGAFLENNNPWQTMAPIWRTSFFRTVGGFDENLLFMEDPDLHLRALKTDIDKLKICYDKPADCFYRIHHNDKTKSGFYLNSILYRILFFKKIVLEEEGSVFYIQHKEQIRKGMLNLLNNFLYYRVNEFRDLFKQFAILVSESKLFTDLEMWRIFALTSIGNHENRILKKMKLKGLCYRLLPK